MKFLTKIPEFFLCPCLRYIRRFQIERDSAAIELQNSAPTSVENAFKFLAQFYQSNQSDLETLSRKYRAACKTLQRQYAPFYAVIEPFLSQNKQGMQDYFENMAANLCQSAKNSSSLAKFQKKATQIEQQVLTMIESFKTFHPQSSLDCMCTDALTGNIEAFYTSFSLAQDPSFLTNLCCTQFTSQLFTQAVRRALSTDELSKRIQQCGHAAGQHCLNQRAGADGFFIHLAHQLKPWAPLPRNIQNTFLAGVRTYLVNLTLPITSSIFSTASDRAFISQDSPFLDRTTYAQLTRRADFEHQHMGDHKA